MKGNDPSLFGALLLSLLVRILLQGQTLFWTRAGLLTLLPGVLISALAGILFARVWPLAQNRLLAALFAALLAAGAAAELLSLWQLYAAAYPDAVSLAGVCLMALLPVLYLRRLSSIAQTANVVLALLLTAGAVLVVSVTDRLHVVNLQSSLAADDCVEALAAQCRVYPELLLPALRQEKGRAADRTVWRLASFAALFQTGQHLLLELFFGAAMPQMAAPLHEAARCGSLSVFDRLEWLQLIVWTMAVSVKLGLYGYAAAFLLRVHSAAENNLRGLPRFSAAAAGLLLACVLLARQGADAPAGWQSAAAAGFALLVVLVGGIRWLIQRCAAGRA